MQCKLDASGNPIYDTNGKFLGYIANQIESLADQALLSVGLAQNLDQFTVQGGNNGAWRTGRNIHAIPCRAR